MSQCWLTVLLLFFWLHFIFWSSVSLILDQGFKAQEFCCFHPLSNDMTICEWECWISFWPLSVRFEVKTSPESYISWKVLLKMTWMRDMLLILVKLLLYYLKSTIKFKGYKPLLTKRKHLQKINYTKKPSSSRKCYW